MSSAAGTENKPHAVCTPYPAQGHINPMLSLAKLLRNEGFHVTFVNTGYNHQPLLQPHGPSTIDGLSDFRLESLSDSMANQDEVERFCELISRLNSSPDVPPVSCIVSDGMKSLTLEAAERFGLPEVLFWTTSACGFLAYTQYRHLVEKGYIPLQVACILPREKKIWILKKICAENCSSALAPNLAQIFWRPAPVPRAVVLIPTQIRF